MYIPRNMRKEIEFIRSSVAESVKLSSLPDECSYLMSHFEYDLPIMRSFLTVDKVTSRIPDQEVSILDWGCGYGDMAYILKNRRPRANITCYDVHDAPSRRVLLERSGLPYIVASHEVELPFKDCSFDYALAIGVLEHVPNESGSLEELHRVLKPGGQLLLFFAPNRWSYTEAIMRKMGKPAHERTYTRRELRCLVASKGFYVESVTYDYLLPIMLTSLPKQIKRLYSWLGNVVLPLDAMGAKIPGLNSVCSNLALAGRKLASKGA